MSSISVATTPEEEDSEAHPSTTSEEETTEDENHTDGQDEDQEDDTGTLIVPENIKISKYYRKIRLIDTGAFGEIIEVKRMEEEHSKKHYVLKRLDREDSSWLREVNHLISLENVEHVIRLNRVLFSKHYVYLEFDLSELSFDDYLHVDVPTRLLDQIRNGEGIDIEAEYLAEVQAVFVKLLTSLSQMHAMGMLHRDIKGENIMFFPSYASSSSSSRVKGGPPLGILDLGMSKRCVGLGVEDYTSVDYDIVTTWYRAPELWGPITASELLETGDEEEDSKPFTENEWTAAESKVRNWIKRSQKKHQGVPKITLGRTTVGGGFRKHSDRSDNWSLGVTLFEMITGYIPFAEERHIDVRRRLNAYIAHRMHGRFDPHLYPDVPDQPYDLENELYRLFARFCITTLRIRDIAKMSSEGKAEEEDEEDDGEEGELDEDDEEDIETESTISTDWTTESSDEETDSEAEEESSSESVLGSDAEDELIQEYKRTRDTSLHWGSELKKTLSSSAWQTLSGLVKMTMSLLHPVPEERASCHSLLATLGIPSPVPVNWDDKRKEEIIRAANSSAGSHSVHTASSSRKEVEALMKVVPGYFPISQLILKAQSGEEWEWLQGKDLLRACSLWYRLLSELSGSTTMTFLACYYLGQLYNGQTPHQQAVDNMRHLYKLMLEASMNREKRQEVLALARAILVLRGGLVWEHGAADYRDYFTESKQFTQFDKQVLKNLLETLVQGNVTGVMSPSEWLAGTNRALQKKKKVR